MEKFTKEQFYKVGHTLGINPYHCLHSKSKKDKELPNKFYRNYYNYGQVRDECQEPKFVAELSEYIDKWNTSSGLLYFQINKKVIELFKKQLKEELTDNK